MITKFETRSNRVKGISFHPKRPWILASLHNGVIQLWDYRMQTLIDRFEEHDAGPVRGVDFHSSQPLFCSGGDDYKIKVWNHKLRRCLFTLLGHLDYIRTVQFHKEQPWIVSASDDQTLRLWNWQGRTCISVLTGHNHYVMSASFHPRDDLVVSSSLDQTLRVWDISGLKKQKSNSTEILNVNLNQELFGGHDVLVKLILEGHEKGVNWASFHPSHPLIVSGADDRSIRIWKMDDARGFEIEQLRGHVNNVSCVMYFKDFIISNSEDRSIRVWDVKQRSAIHTFRRDSDRFWILAVHPERNLIAAGHDTGLLVFKLERERPAHTINNGVLYWVKERQLKSYDFQTEQEETLLQLRRSAFPPTTVSYCPTEKMALFYYDADGGTFELYALPRSGVGSDDVKKGFYNSAVFFTRTKFAVLDKTRQVVIRNTKNDIVRVLPPIGGADLLFPAAQGQVLARSEDKVSLFDMSQKKVVGECSASKVKYVVWSADMNRVALLSKHAIFIANRKLRSQAQVHETSRIKSAAFDEKGVLIYATLNHLKYCLPTGDTGTIKTLENPIYLLRAQESTVWYLDRDGKVEKATIDSTEYKFKSALSAQQFHDVLRIIKKTPIHGQAMVAYLQQKSFPEIAMHFVKDDNIRFNLAIQCGNLEIAKETALKLNEPQYWQTIAQVAMRHGNVQLVELALQRVGEADKLCFLYTVTGNLHRLGTTATDPLKKADTNTRMQAALLTGDIECRLRVLEEAGQYSLAYKVAQSNGLEEKAEAFLAKAKEQLARNVAQSSARGEEAVEEIAETVGAAIDANVAGQPSLPALPAPEPHCATDNWPLLPVQKAFFERFLLSGGKHDLEMEETDGEARGAWGEDELDLDSDKGDKEDDPFADDDDIGGDAAEGGQEGGGAWGGMDDLLEGEGGGADWGGGLDISDPEDGGDAGGSAFYMPSAGISSARAWTQNSTLPVDHVAAGAFEMALPALRRQCGIINFEPLKAQAMAIYLSATASLPTCALLPSHALYLNRPSEKTGGRQRDNRLPAICTSINPLQERLKVAYKATTDGNFASALTHFKFIMCATPLIVVSDKKEDAELKDLLCIAREYAAALRLEATRREITDNAKRQLELAAYFTHANLQPTHIALTLGAGMAAAYKAKCFATASKFAKRLLELNPNPKTTAQARKVIQLSEQNNGSEALDLQYDDRNPFVVCGETMAPIYRGQESLKCAFCFQPFTADCRGKVCAVCGMGEVGGESTGMRNMY